MADPADIARYMVWLADVDLALDGPSIFARLEKLDEINEIAQRGGKGSLDEIRRALS